jgi:Tfp pilus assembly protein PilF
MATLGVPVFQSTNPGEYKQRALASARRAVALDPKNADAHLALALTSQAVFNWEAAGKEYQAAIAIDPNAAVLHQYGRWFLYTGRIREGLRELEKAERLDPFYTLTVAFLAHAYSLNGQHSQAIATAKRALEIDSTLVGSNMFGMRVLLEGGREAEARALALKHANHKDTELHILAFAAYTLGRTGDLATARRLIEEIKTRPNEEHRRSRALATAYLGVGDTTNAMKALEDGLDSGDARPELNSFSDQPFDVLRGSQRFATIIRRYGLDDAVFSAPGGGRP